MTAKDENAVLEKLQNQTVEAEKIEKGLHDFNEKYDQKSEAHVEALLKIVDELQSINSGNYGILQINYMLIYLLFVNLPFNMIILTKTSVYFRRSSVQWYEISNVLITVKY